jgi:hypothetical protein
MAQECRFFAARQAKKSDRGRTAAPVVKSVENCLNLGDVAALAGDAKPRELLQA